MGDYKKQRLHEISNSLYSFSNGLVTTLATVVAALALAVAIMVATTATTTALRGQILRGYITNRYNLNLEVESLTCHWVVKSITTVSSLTSRMIPGIR